MIFLKDLTKSQCNYFIGFKIHKKFNYFYIGDLESLLLLSKSFSINLAPLQDELIELQAEHYELLNNDYIRLWRSTWAPGV